MLYTFSSIDWLSHLFPTRMIGLLDFLKMLATSKSSAERFCTVSSTNNTTSAFSIPIWACFWSSCSSSSFFPLASPPVSMSSRLYPSRSKVC